jgi:hypothetical protein
MHPSFPWTLPHPFPMKCTLISCPLYSYYLVSSSFFILCTKYLELMPDEEVMFVHIFCLWKLVDLDVIQYLVSTLYVVINFNLRSSLFWDVSQWKLVLSYQHFGAAYWSYLLGSICARIMAEHVCTWICRDIVTSDWLTGKVTGTNRGAVRGC